MPTATNKQTAKADKRKAERAKPRRAAKTRSGGMSATVKNELPHSAFAFPKERKVPINDASHVRNAVARFDQAEGVSDAERDAAWKRIRSAARKHGVEINERG